MGIDCGSQCILCDLPIRLDTFSGCSHRCAYCFAARKKDIKNVRPLNCAKALENFIKGKRTGTTNWCDWKIPLHWGGMSDPFQPLERKYRTSLRCLKVFEETGYPFIVSTKGKMICEPEYLSLLRRCNAVVQISMVCDLYDKLEPGAPTYEERIEMIKILSKNCRRVIVRVQPYMPEIFIELLENIPRLKAAGAYGLTIEGMKFPSVGIRPSLKEKLVKVDGDYCYPKATLARDYATIRDRCHKVGLAFYCAENRLRTMGDNMTCCGINGLGYKVNEFNVLRVLAGEASEPTENMKKIGTAGCFKASHQDTEGSERLKYNSFYTMMAEELEKAAKGDRLLGSEER